MGNAFLSHIRAIDAIFQVVRAFDDAEIVHVEGTIPKTPCPRWRRVLLCLRALLFERLRVFCFVGPRC